MSPHFQGDTFNVVQDEYGPLGLGRIIYNLPTDLTHGNILAFFPETFPSI